jgi:hypothetical protein
VNFYEALAILTVLLVVMGTQGCTSTKGARVGGKACLACVEASAEIETTETTKGPLQ